jgi:hypothetical protein
MVWLSRAEANFGPLATDADDEWIVRNVANHNTPGME